jgi:hypothetical protein
MQKRAARGREPWASPLFPTTYRLLPLHTPDKNVVKDIEHWRDYCQGPAWLPGRVWNVGRTCTPPWTEKAYKETLSRRIFESRHHLCGSRTR